MIKTCRLHLRPSQKLSKVFFEISPCGYSLRCRRSSFLPFIRPPNFQAFSTAPQRCKTENQTPHRNFRKPTFRENIYTLPNLLTVSRICACPVLSWSILHDNFYFATGLLVYAGLTDLIDGFLARRFKMNSVLGTILDPAADKILMTTLTITLAIQDLLPTPLAIVIIGRDVLLSLSAFYIRYTSLPHPKTFARYWDFSIPSAEVHPTFISKVNTVLQLLLMGVTTLHPILPFDFGLELQGLQLMVATTTIWSGLSYIFSKNAVRILSKREKLRP